MFKASVFSGSNFEKRSWKPGNQITCLAVFGSVKMDFQQAQLEQSVTHVRCITIFGNIQLRVPKSITINMSGVSLFGKTRDKGTEVGAAKSDHILEIDSFNVFGTTDIIN